MAEYNANKLPTLAFNDKFYVYVGDRKLIECEPQNTDFFLEKAKENGDRVYSMQTKFLHKGYQVIDVFDFKNVFTSIENFEKGISAELKYIALDTFEGFSRNVLIEIFNDYDHETPVYFTVDKDGCLKNHKLDLKHLTYNYNKGGWTCRNAPTGDFYMTREEAVSFNKFKVVNKDGNETLVRGVNNLLMLDEDQKELVANFKQMLDSLINHGIYIKADYDNNIYAYNVRNIADYGHGMDEEGFEEADSNNKRFVVAHIEEYTSDNLLWIKRRKGE